MEDHDHSHRVHEPLRREQSLSRRHRSAHAHSQCRADGGDRSTEDRSRDGGYETAFPTAHVAATRGMGGLPPIAAGRTI